MAKDEKNGNDGLDEESVAHDLIVDAAGGSLGLIEPVEAIMGFIETMLFVTREVDRDMRSHEGEKEFDVMIVDLIERLEKQDYKDFADWVG